MVSSDIALLYQLVQQFDSFCVHISSKFIKFFFGSGHSVKHILLVLNKFLFGTCMAYSPVGGAVFPLDSSLVDDEDSSLLKLPQEAQRLLQTLALNLWSGMLLADVEDVCVRQLKGAFTNEVYECCWNTSHDDEENAALAATDGEGRVNMASETEGKQQITESKQRSKKRRVVLVRVYGEGADIFFNRDDEIRTFEAVSRSGHGPRLLGRFPNGRVEEFLHARTLTAEDLREPDVSTRIAVKLREFHRLSMPGSVEAHIWRRLRDWLQKALDFSSPKHVKEFQLKELGAEIEDLRLRLSGFDSEIRFCHNDLQYGNIMMDEEDNTLTLIDYEYATYNPVAYDLANHFCEMAANYHTDTPHVLDFSKYPDMQERCRFIEAYLGIAGKDGSSLQVEQLLNEVDLYALASHIHWGLWGLISDYANDIDFDYIEYARQRFKQYWLSK